MHFMIRRKLSFFGFESENFEFLKFLEKKLEMGGDEIRENRLKRRNHR